MASKQKGSALANNASSNTEAKVQDQPVGHFNAVQQPTQAETNIQLDQFTKPNQVSQSQQQTGINFYSNDNAILSKHDEVEVLLQNNSAGKETVGTNLMTDHNEDVNSQQNVLGELAESRHTILNPLSKKGSRQQNVKSAPSTGGAANAQRPTHQSVKNSPYMVYTVKASGALASQEYESRAPAGSKGPAAAPVPARRKMKSIEKIYESVQPVGRTGIRDLSRRRGMQNVAPDKAHLLTSQTQQSMGTIPTSSYRQLARPEPDTTGRLPAAHGILQDRKQSQHFAPQTKLSRSAQRGGGRPHISNRAGRKFQAEAAKASDFMTVQSHKEGPKTAHLVSIDQGHPNHAEKLRTLVARDGKFQESTIGRYIQDSDPQNIVQDIHTHGQAQQQAQAPSGTMFDRSKLIGNAYNSVVDKNKDNMHALPYDSGAKKAPRPRSNARSTRSSVKPIRPEAANFNKRGNYVVNQYNPVATNLNTQSHRYNFATNSSGQLQAQTNNAKEAEQNKVSKPVRQRTHEVGQNAVKSQGQYQSNNLQDNDSNTKQTKDTINDQIISDDMQAYEAALSAAIQQDKIVLESIQKNWTEVTKRIMQRSNLLQTVQTKGDREINKDQSSSIQVSNMADTLTINNYQTTIGNQEDFLKDQAAVSIQTHAKESNLDPNLQTIGSTNLNDQRQLGNIDSGNNQNNISQLFFVDKQDGGITVSEFPKMDMSYLTQKTPLVQFSTKDSPEKKQRMKNDVQQLAQVYRPGAFRSVNYQQINHQKLKNNKAQLQANKSGESRISASNKRSVQSSRGRGLKGPPVWRGANYVNGSQNHQQIINMEQSPVGHFTQKIHQNHIGDALPTTIIQSNWNLNPSSSATLDSGPKAQQSLVLQQLQKTGLVIHKSLNTLTAGEPRRGLSKSTLRSDIRNQIDQTASISNIIHPYKHPGTRSVRRSRPIISNISQSTAIQNNAKIRRNQSSANIRKVQLKKTIQQVIVQDNNGQEQINGATEQKYQDQNRDQCREENEGKNVDESALVVTSSVKGTADSRQIMIQEFQTYDNKKSKLDDQAIPISMNSLIVFNQQSSENTNMAAQYKSTKHNGSSQMNKMSEKQMDQCEYLTQGAQNKSVTQHGINASYGRAISVPPMVKKLHQQQLQRKETLAAANAYGQVQSMRTQVSSVPSGKLLNQQDLLKSQISQQRAKSTKRPSAVAGSQGESVSAAQNIKMIVQSGRIRPSVVHPQNTQNNSIVANSRKQSNVQRKIRATKSQRLHTGHPSIKVKTAGSNIGSKQIRTASKESKDLEIEEESTSRYNLTNNTNNYAEAGLYKQGETNQFKQGANQGVQHIQQRTEKDLNFIQGSIEQTQDSPCQSLRQQLFQQHSQSPDLQAQIPQNNVFARKMNRQMANQGIISNQFSFENGQMMICSNEPSKAQDDIKQIDVQQINDAQTNISRQQNRYGNQAQQEEMIADYKIHKNNQFYVEQISQNLNDQQSVDFEKPLQVSKEEHESLNMKNTTEILAQRTKLGLSPLEIQRWNQGPELQFSQGSQDDAYAEMNESDLVMRQLHNQQTNRGRKILISQIIENSKNPNLVSVNEAILHQNRLEDFHKKLEGFENSTNNQQNRRMHNETINSSNLVMNQRDRQNIRDFLSANHSGVGCAALELDGLSDLNGHVALKLNQNIQMSTGLNLNSNDRDSRAQENASYPLIAAKKVQKMQFQTKPNMSSNKEILDVSYLKNTVVGNPLLNESMNRSQLSGNVLMSALALSPQDYSAKKGIKQEHAVNTQANHKLQGPTSDLVENPTFNLREKLNQRYQEDCEDAMMIINHQNKDNTEDVRENQQKNQLIQIRSPDRNNSKIQVTDGEQSEQFNESVSGSQSQIQQVQLDSKKNIDDDDAMLIESCQQINQQTTLSVVIEQPDYIKNNQNQKQVLQEQANTKVIQRLIPFDADDEPIAEQYNVPINQQNVLQSKFTSHQTNPTVQHSLQQKRPSFVRKRHIEKNSNKNSMENTSGVKSNDQTVVESGHKNTILSTNSTGLGLGAGNLTTKMEQLNNSKTTISSPKTIDTSKNQNIIQIKNQQTHLPFKANLVNTRKSAFLFGSQSRVAQMTQNNLRYSQQQCSGLQQHQGVNKLRNNQQMKSVAININRTNDIATTGAGIAPIKSLYIDESAVVQEAEELDNSKAQFDFDQFVSNQNQHSYLTDPNPTNLQIDEQIQYNVVKNDFIFREASQKQNDGLKRQVNRTDKMNDTQKSTISRAANLAVSDQITEQYAEEQDHTSTSQAKSQLDVDETPPDSFIPTIQSQKSNNQDGSQLNRETHNVLDKDQGISSNNIEITGNDQKVIQDHQNEPNQIFTQKLELIQSFDSSDLTNLQTNNKQSSKISKQKSDQIGLEKQCNISSLKDLDLLHDQIFKQSQNNQQNEPGLPRRSTSKIELKKSTSLEVVEPEGEKQQQNKRKDSDLRMSEADDVLIESLQSKASERSKQNSPPSKTQQKKPTNDKGRQFLGSDKSNQRESKSQESDQPIRSEMSSRLPSQEDIMVKLDEEYEDSTNVVARLRQPPLGPQPADAQTPSRYPDFYPAKNLGSSGKTNKGFPEQKWPEMSGNQLKLSSSRLRLNDSSKQRDEDGKTMPAHSDDEVTPRRGLDEPMSEAKLRQLNEQLDSMSLGTGRQSEAEEGASQKIKGISGLNKDARQQAADNTEIMSDLNAREDYEVSVLLEPDSWRARNQGKEDQPGETDFVRESNSKPIPTLRLMK